MKKKVMTLFITIGLVAGLVTGCGSGTQKQNEVSNNTKTEQTVEAEQTKKTEPKESEEDASIESDFVGEGLNEAKTIRIGYTANGSFNLKRLDDKFKWITDEFAQDQVEVEWVEFQYGPPMIEALATGSLEIAYGIGDTPIINGLANNVPVQAIGLGPHSKTSTAIIVSGELKDEVKELKDLKGKKVALSIGSTNQDFIAKELESVGLSESDVELINITTVNDQLAALLNNEIDVAVNIEPNASYLVQEAGAFKLDYGEPLKISYGYLVANKDFLEKNPELAARFVKQNELAKEYIKENLEEYKKYYAEATQFDVQLLDFMNNWEYRGDLGDDIGAVLKSTADFMLKIGQLETEVNLSDAYTNRYVEESKKLLEGNK